MNEYHEIFGNICETSFDNKTIEIINLSCIFHDPLVKAALPNTSAHFDTPTASWDDNSTLHCECTGSPFGGKDHNQIITSNSKLINNNRFRKHSSKGPKFCEYRFTGYQKAKESIITGIKSFIEYWYDKQSVTHHHILNGKSFDISNL